MVTPSEDVFLVSSLTAHGMCENLIHILGTMMANLPESELRKVRDALENSVHIADDILCDMISSSFEGLSVSDVSTTLSDGTSFIGPASPHLAGPCPARGANTSDVLAQHMPPVITRDSERIVVEQIRNTNPTPVSTPVSTPAPALVSPLAPAPILCTPIPTPVLTPTPVSILPASTHNSVPSQAIRTPGEYGMIISSHPRVGVPDYTYHPAFVVPGIPGPYLRPPIAPSGPIPTRYYVVTRGLYVGIFTDWNECAPWVQGVSGNAHRSFRQWREAMLVYNSRLAAGACEVLS